MPTLLTEDELYAKAVELFTPNQSPSIFAWCEEHLHIRDGKWTARRARALRHFYDIASARLTGIEKPGDPYAHQCQEMYLVTITQIAKTTFILAVLAWLMAHKSFEMGLYMPREKDYRRIKDRSLKPMITKTDALADLLPKSIEGRENALSANSIELGAALLHLLNGNIIEDLRGLPMPFIAVEEFEQLAADIADQGDPIDLMLGRQRTKKFDRLLLASSSCAAVTGHAWRRLCTGSHERLLVACENCGIADYLDMDHIMLDPGVTGTTLLSDFPPEIIRKEGLARWHCSAGCIHDGPAVGRMLETAIRAQSWVAGKWAQTDDHPRGIWTPESKFDTNGRLLEIIPPETIIRSGWANAFYSMDASLDNIAATKVEKFDHGSIENKKVWTNTEANNPFIYTFTPPGTDDYKQRASQYAFGSCPVEPDYLFLVADQQGNQPGKFWYPWVLRGFNRGGESWLIACGKAMSEDEFNALEDRTWPVGNKHRAPDIVVKDVANPNYRSRYGYVWAAEAPETRFCLRGEVRQKPGELWKEVPIPKTTSRSSRPADVHEWTIHPHEWRSELQDRLMGKEDRPAWHLPAADSVPDYYFKSMTAEEMAIEPRSVVGGGIQDCVVWNLRVTSRNDKTINRRSDNHFADAEKMALAIADILGVNNTDTDDPHSTGEESAGTRRRRDRDDEPDTEDRYLDDDTETDDPYENLWE